MKRCIKTFLFIGSWILGGILLKDFCHQKTQGFSLSKASSSFAQKPLRNIPSEEKERLDLLLEQPFYFMEKGFQCYAFVSKDQQYVLKLLRWKELEPSFWHYLLPPSFQKKIFEEKKKKKEHDFTSYLLAEKHVKEDTGLIYLHLEKTQGLHKTLTLYDAIGVKLTIEADQIEFLLQKKVEPFLPFFQKHQKDPQVLKRFFSDLARAIKHRVQNQITDSDISLEYNMGVFNGSPVLFDIGNLSLLTSPPSSIEKQLRQEARLILSYLESHSPQLALFFEKELLAP